jgi:hypothetical protein
MGLTAASLRMSCARRNLSQDMQDQAGSDRAHITDLGCVKVSDVRPQSQEFVFFGKSVPTPGIS